MRTQPASESANSCLSSLHRLRLFSPTRLSLPKTRALSLPLLPHACQRWPRSGVLCRFGAIRRTSWETQHHPHPRKPSLMFIPVYSRRRPCCFIARHFLITFIAPPSYLVAYHEVPSCPYIYRLNKYFCDMITTIASFIPPSPGSPPWAKKKTFGKG